MAEGRRRDAEHRSQRKGKGQFSKFTLMSLSIRTYCTHAQVIIKCICVIRTRSKIGQNLNIVFKL